MQGLLILSMCSIPELLPSLRKCHFHISVHLEECPISIIKIIHNKFWWHLWQVDQIWSDCPQPFFDPVKLDPLPRWDLEKKCRNKHSNLVNCQAGNSILRWPVKVTFVFNRQ
jgi:hypothetical protein